MQVGISHRRWVRFHVSASACVLNLKTPLGKPDPVARANNRVTAWICAARSPADFGRPSVRIGAAESFMRRTVSGHSRVGKPGPPHAVHAEFRAVMAQGLEFFRASDGRRAWGAADRRQRSVAARAMKKRRASPAFQGSAAERLSGTDCTSRWRRARGSRPSCRSFCPPRRCGRSTRCPPRRCGCP